MPLLFFLFPFIGLYNGIKHFPQSKYRYGLLFFAFWFGYSVYFYGGDIISYHDDYALLVRYSWNDFFHIILNFNNDTLKFAQVSFNTFNAKPDFYAVTLGFLVSRFTENPRWFFAIASVIYFYLIMKFLDQAMIFTGNKKSKGWLLFFLALVLIVPFYVGVTGIRFWPALFLFSWMLLKYINSGQNKYIFFTAFSILFHYTFLFPVTIAYLIKFIKINKTFFKIFILIGIVYALLSTTTSSLNFIRDTLNLFGSDTINNATTAYLDENELGKRVSNFNATNWYVSWRGHLLNLYFILFFIIDFFEFNSWEKVKANTHFDKLYQFFFIVALFTFNLDSLGRFVYVFYILIIIRIISLQYNDTYNKLHIWNILFLPILILHVLVTFRAGFYYIDPLLFISPSPALLFIHSNISLSEFLIGH